MAALPGVKQRPHFTPHPRGDTSWQERSACRDTDPEAFFPEHSVRINKGVRRICQGCEVQSACLEYALLRDIRDGVWGGLSVAERRALERKGKP